ncbi:DNA polymerase III subunit gamma and tau [Gephyromycinifex aptenodytis]|uniref:DNA polymerase III subunit gamma and tau n=1 Tax=Gephyromycinifex aptenodytis TaxID=2716227 RepID=UPI001445213C|nr:DNA polymerase III subunit gamma and tau [Gephyromycinifex aptenodytis]
MTTALYRRYRPADFADVIGQEHVTEPLMQALRSGRVGHAYLFSGPRGCGKTTSARILARCLNCEEGPTPTPCGHCESCVALAAGGTGSVDVIEIDAASHGGVEDARDLREKAAYGPAQSRYKVYIIDEAHMVTPQGFNALLKIVEEPPEHVKFVFATTEPEKVIGTIRSRTHHYPFRLVPPARLQEYLEHLCTQEGVQVEPGVLSFVVRAGGGSVRDSLSVLDQLISGSDEAGLTYAGAAALLGFTEGELLDATIAALAAGDAAGVFRQVDRVVETGQDPRRFVEDLLERFRDLIVVAAVGAGGDVALSAVLRGVPEDQLDRMRQQAASFGPGQLSYAADIVNAGLTEMTGATSPRLQLELLCARLLLPTGAGEHGYAARLDRLERRVGVDGVPTPPARPNEQRTAAPHSQPHSQPHAAPSAPAPTPGAAPQRGAADPGAPAHGGRADAAGARGSQPQESPATHAPAGGPERRTRQQGGSQQEPAAQAPAAAESQAAQRPRPPGSGPRGGVDTEMIRRNWTEVLQRIFGIRRVTWTFLSEHAQVLDYDGTRLLLGLSTKGLATTFRNGPHAEVVRQALSEQLGVDTRVEGIPASDAPAAFARPAESAAGAPVAEQAAPSAPPQRPAQPEPRSQQQPAQPEPSASSRWAPGPDSRAPGQDSRAPAQSNPNRPPAGGYSQQRPSQQQNPAAGSVDARGADPRESEPRPQPSPPLGEPAVPSPGGWDEVPPPGDEDAPPPEDVPPPEDEPRGGKAAFLAARRSGYASPGARQRPGRGQPRASDDEASVDDEDIPDAGAVGQPVIARVLGGVVIDEREE